MLYQHKKRSIRQQQGITGLETAIILIAFVVVAAVFAYTVLSAGLFSSQKSSEAVYAGLEETQSTMELKGSVLADALCELDDCESAWTNGTTLSPTAAIEGANCVFTDVTGAGTAAYDTLATSRDFSNNHSIRMWIKVDAGTTAADDLDFWFSASTTGGSTVASWDLPALSDTEWDYVTLETPTSGSWGACSAVRSMGITSDGDPTGNLYIDIVETEPILSTTNSLKAYANEIIFTVANALNGKAIDFANTTDSDEQGLISDETSGSTNHKVLISYSDLYQYVNDMAWTKVAVGNDDNDDLLEVGEKFQITIDLKYINNQAGVTTPSDDYKVGEHHNFTIEVKPPQGAVLTIERSMPSIIHTLSNLT